MDFQEKYHDNLEVQLKEIKDDIRHLENRISGDIREAMHKIYMQSDQRHREYIKVDNRMNEVMAGIDKKQKDQDKWILRTAIAVILGVASLVSTAVFGMVKLVDIISRP